MHELHGKRARQRLDAPSGKYDRGRFDGPSTDPEQTIGGRVGLVALDAADRDLPGKAAEIFNQNDLQGDRGGPEFADRQRLDFLIGADIFDEGFSVETTVGMRHESPCQAEHTWVTRERAGEELGKQSIVARRQIRFDGANLRFDEMIIVDQPFGSRRQRAIVRDRLDYRLIRGQQQHAVFGEAGRQRPASCRKRRGRLSGREAARMRL